MNSMVEGKVALVVGGGSGIGRESATLFAEQGASVIVADIDSDAGSETVARILSSGGNSRFVAVDATQPEQVERMVADTAEGYGRLDCAHNSVGIMGNVGSIADMPYDEWKRVVDINLNSVFLCLKYQVAQMKRQGGGSIVNTASGAGIVGLPTLPHYTATKHGVLGLTKSVALECLHGNIRVNAVCPGTTDTPFLQKNIQNNSAVEQHIRDTLTAKGEFGDPRDVAQAVVWLCSDLSGWVAGESMMVDGGFICR